MISSSSSSCEEDEKDKKSSKLELEKVKHPEKIYSTGPDTVIEPKSASRRRRSKVRKLQIIVKN